MKMTYTVGMASALLLAAGCAHEERSVRTSDTDYSSGRISQYNAAPSVGGSYSADGSYLSGGGGAYATPGGASSGGNYSGTVGADGSYIPNADSGAVSSGMVNGSGAESDDIVIAQVRESLRRDPEIALIVPNIQISAHNGAIILNGSVQSEGQKRQILSKVQGVTGVVTVNNQLNVMAGANAQNPNGLAPTGNDSGSQPLYKDAANGQDNSSNNALNATSRQNGGTQIYQQGNNGMEMNSDGQLWQNGKPQNNSSSSWNTNLNDQMSPTSRSNSPNQIYHDSNQGTSGQQQNGNSSTNNLSPTSRSGSQNQIYQNGQGQTNQGQNGQNSREQNLNNMNSSSNLMNNSSSTLSPTSREGGSSQIYQNNPGEKLPNQNTNGVQNP